MSRFLFAADAIETEIMGTKTVVGVKRSREQDLDDNEVDTVAEAMLDLVPKPELQVTEGDAAGTPNDTNTLGNGDTPNKSSKKSTKKKKKTKVRGECGEGMCSHVLVTNVCLAEQRIFKGRRRSSSIRNGVCNGL